MRILSRSGSGRRVLSRVKKCRESKRRAARTKFIFLSFAATAVAVAVAEAHAKKIICDEILYGYVTVE